MTVDIQPLKTKEEVAEMIKAFGSKVIQQYGPIVEQKLNNAIQLNCCVSLSAVLHNLYSDININIQ